MKRRICVVITARPSYSRIRTALEAIKAHEGLELLLVVAASALLDKWGGAIEVIKKDGFQVTETVYNLVEGENLMTSVKTTGLGMIELAGIFNSLKPDAVVTIADRYETIATAIAAAYMNIPLVHVQGGEVTGNIDEKVRHAITKLSDIHFVATEKAKERVVRMGEDPGHVFNTGCPSLDIARRVLGTSENGTFDPLEKYSGVGKLLPNRSDYLVVLQHPVTTEVDEGRAHIRQTYEAIRDIPAQIYWFWPNVDSGSDQVSKALRAIREIDAPSNIYFFKNLPSDAFLLLLNGAKCIVGNSSVAIREASFLGVPAVNIGSRQTGRERGWNVQDVPHDKAQIRKAVEAAMKQTEPRQREHLYGEGQSGEIIADLLAKIEFVSEKRLQY